MYFIIKRSRSLKIKSVSFISKKLELSTKLKHVVDDQPFTCCR